MNLTYGKLDMLVEQMVEREEVTEQLKEEKL